MIFRKPNKLRVFQRRWVATHIMTHKPLLWEIETPVDVISSFKGINIVRDIDGQIYNAPDVRLKEILNIT